AGAAVAARALEAGATGDTEPLDPVAQDFEENPALRDWRAGKGDPRRQSSVDDEGEVGVR
ncbi:hypothetical protein KUV73_20460, partial [Mameliella alba]|nr:hypothetical protein [Mameliella alba]MBY6176754.1 hypothetical protein [Mameliella alba]